MCATIEPSCLCILPHVDCYHKSPHACECFATCCTAASCSPLWMPQRCVANAVQLLHVVWLPPLPQSHGLSHSMLLHVVQFCHSVCCSVMYCHIAATAVLYVATCHTVAATVLRVTTCHTVASCHTVATTVYTTVLSIAACRTVATAVSVICCRMLYSCFMLYSCCHRVCHNVTHVFAACCIVALRCTTCTVAATVYTTVLRVASCHTVVSCCTVAATAYAIGLSVQLFRVALLVQFLPLNATVLFVATCHTVAATVYATVLCVAACCTVASCCTVAATVYATVLGVAACCTVT